MTTSVFVSRASALNAAQRVAFDQWCTALTERGFRVHELPRACYTDDPWTTLTAVIRAVDGVVLFGFASITIREGVRNAGTVEATHAPVLLASPWVQLEAGIAVASGRPVLALAEPGVVEGVFDPFAWRGPVIGASVSSGSAAQVIDELESAMRGSARPVYVSG